MLTTPRQFLQGDVEKALDLPVSRFMDRLFPEVPTCQIGFIDFIVTPIYKALGELCPGIRATCLPIIESNRAMWAEVQKAAAATTVPQPALPPTPPVLGAAWSGTKHMESTKGLRAFATAGIPNRVFGDGRSPIYDAVFSTELVQSASTASHEPVANTPSVVTPKPTDPSFHSKPALQHPLLIPATSNWNRHPSSTSNIADGRRLSMKFLPQGFKNSDTLSHFNTGLSNESGTTSMLATRAPSIIISRRKSMLDAKPVLGRTRSESSSSVHEVPRATSSSSGV